jgi:glutamine amidotransferase
MSLVALESTLENLRMIEVTIIDYGAGNLLSIIRALEHCGARVTITSNATAILTANRVVLPGVGAFANGMESLKTKGLDAVVRQIAASGTPLLGICLGMQLLFDASEEFGLTEGLGLIPGRVVSVPQTTAEGKPHKIPHIGWNELILAAQRDSWQDSLLADVKPGESVYFVHSFMSAPSCPDFRLADCSYGGIPIAASVMRDNVMGCQFHPEKSGEVA